MVGSCNQTAAANSGVDAPCMAKHYFVGRLPSLVPIFIACILADKVCGRRTMKCYPRIRLSLPGL